SPGTTVTNPAPTAHSRLNFHVGDVEAMQEFRWGPYWMLRASAGGRFAYLQQAYEFNDSRSVVIAGTPKTSAESSASAAHLSSLSHFAGGGPTLALELRRNFPKCHVNVYAIGRGALLYGEFEQDAELDTASFLSVAKSGTSSTLNSLHASRS